jgi:hypothetical protein
VKLRFTARENVQVPSRILKALEKIGELAPNPDRADGYMWGDWMDALDRLLGAPTTELGEGSSRVVFELDEHLALKLAITTAGVAQNRAEYATYRTARDCSMITKIFYYHQGYQWLLVEKGVRRPVNVDFQIYGFEGIYPLMRYIDSPDPKNWRWRLGQDINRPLPEFESDYQELRRLVERNSKDAGELVGLEQWVIVERNGQEYPVLADYGFSDKVRKQHYTHRSTA